MLEKWKSFKVCRVNYTKAEWEALKQELADTAREMSVIHADMLEDWQVLDSEDWLEESDMD
ncbi:hypothetical protein K8I28_09975 [bacterium]|nr:hypothetical protein [bacterium]